MLLPSTGISGLSFDPFLRDIHGADVVHATEGIFRAITALRRHDIVVAYRERVDQGWLEGPFSLRLSGRCPLRVGDEVSLSLTQGRRHVGVRTSVADVVCTDNGTAVRLSQPSFAVFAPGRRHMRVKGSLGAKLVVDLGGRRMPARGLDISIGGIGLILDDYLEVEVGDRAHIYFDFHEERVCLPATVRRTILGSDGPGLGLEFDHHDPRIARRLEESMS